jgi:hypothetical protein
MHEMTSEVPVACLEHDVIIDNPTSTQLSNVTNCCFSPFVNVKNRCVFAQFPLLRRKKATFVV